MQACRSCPQTALDNFTQPSTCRLHIARIDVRERLQAKTNISGKGKGKVISNKGEGVAAQQFQLRLGKNTTVPLTLGFTKSNELFVGRLAMLGFAAACIGEVVSGQGCACPPCVRLCRPFAGYSITLMLCSVTRCSDISSSCTFYRT